jgi:hypothetical protein
MQAPQEIIYSYNTKPREKTLISINQFFTSDIEEDKISLIAHCLKTGLTSDKHPALYREIYPIHKIHSKLL